ncbi:MAG: YggS family pyridoxal phosphate-dependent enzyme [Candidatus Fonsibacter sp.]|nr:YggS family pyridoxal phosphate-dependent enzyme [Candidatus Fonsibacter sp.]
MSILQNYLNIKNEAEILNSNINIVVVTKGQHFVNIKPIIDQGHLDFGENRVQEALLKWSEYIRINSNINLHLIGKLQSNKAKDAIKIFNFIHSLDNEKLAITLASLEVINNRKINYFIQVNIGTEKHKSGIDVASVNEFVNYCSFDLKLNILGLMCIPPLNIDSSEYFLNLKSLNDNLKLKNLSIGMSNDFKVAIQCGSSHIRIGSAIFKSSN